MLRCRSWARISALRKAAGQVISPQDAWIAATAVTFGLPLITSNPGGFAEIDGLKGLVESGDMTIEQAQARFIELLEKHRLVGERLMKLTGPLPATPIDQAMDETLRELFAR